ncbi:MAG TPA: hypothetical protein VFT34_13815 [Verrucomicrobiae bacterium]|nr:hypothetical protein [Verrucomicrobiae bacterium]
MSLSRSAIVTVAFGHSTEHLDHTFNSFAMNPGVPLHAIILGRELPNHRLDGITYHLVESVPDFSHPLREVYLRRIELIDRLDVDFALVVDSYDVLCLQPLPPFEKLLAGADVAACVEHMGARYVIGQGYTANFLNGGVVFWNVPGSRDIRREIVERGRRHFRTIADDQYCINEVIQTKYFDRLRILPCQFNYRAYLNRKQRGWPTVTHLDGVYIFHNATTIDEAKKLMGKTRSRAELPPLPDDGRPLTERQQFWRKLRLRLEPWVIK